jgi:hypothetical protein
LQAARCADVKVCADTALEIPVVTTKTAKASFDTDCNMGPPALGDKDRRTIEQHDLSLNRLPALSHYLSMIFSENRYPLFRIMP